MNKLYFDICKTILGNYNSSNAYEFQLLYLLCYVCEIMNSNEIVKLLKYITLLKKSISNKNDLLYNIFLEEQSKNIYDLKYGTDFNIRAGLYFDSLRFNNDLNKLNFNTQIKLQKKYVQNLYYILRLYYILFGEKNVIFKNQKKLSKYIYEFTKQQITKSK